jgi:hypothetical protein
VTAGMVRRWRGGRLDVELSRGRERALRDAGRILLAGLLLTVGAMAGRRWRM